MSGRQVTFLVFKIGFAAAAITWLFWNTDASRVWSIIRDAHAAPIALGIFLCFLTILIAGWRWNRLLAAAEIPIAFVPLYLIAQIGQFFMVFLPGPAGDDITRMIYISRLAKTRAARACAIVAVDRVIGLSSILVLASICVPSQWTHLSSSPQTHSLALGVLAAGASIAAAGILFLVLPGPALERILERGMRLLPGKDLARRFSTLAALLHRRRRALTGVFLAALCTQLLLCGLFCLAGRAIGIELPLFVWMSFVPIVIASNAVPITVAGIGVREYLVILFLSVLAGVDRETALASSIVAFGMMLSMSLLGGLVYIFYRPALAPDDSSAVSQN